MSTPLVAALLAVAVAAGAAGVQFPTLTGRVVDTADILSVGTEGALNRQLEAHDRATGQQIVVATVADLGGLDIQDYGYQLGRHWKIGGKADDTGVVLVVAPTLRKVRIDVGYGLEGDLTDAVSANIIQTRILPQFRKGDMDAGVRAGVDAIIAVLGGQGEAVRQRAPEARGLPVLIFWLIVVFIVMSAFSGRRGGGGGVARAIVWGTVLNGMSNGRSRGSGGFGGGGGFRGGGGSFGGGGASGSW